MADPSTFGVMTVNQFLADAFVVFMLCSPVDPMLPSEAPEGVYETLKEIADLVEITTKADTWNEPHQWHFEVDWCRRWVRTLWDCPPVEVAKSLPDNALCRSRWMLALEYQNRLEYVQQAKPERDLGPLLRDAEWRTLCWSLATDATNPHAQVRCRRLCLHRIGQLTEWNGLPSHVNLDHLQPLP